MIDTNTLIKKLDIFYPLSSSEKWDKSGFALKNKENLIINKIFICLDLTIECLESIKNNKPDIVITHHPFFFEETKQEDYSKAPYKKTIYQYLKKNKIQIYSLHTNYDNSKYGTTFQIIKQLGFNNYQKFNNYLINVEEKIRTIDLIDKIKKEFNFLNVFSNISKEEAKNVINKIAFFAGAGDIEQIVESFRQDQFDLIVTSDLKWNQLLTLDSLKINYLIVPHNIEEVFVDNLSSVLLEIEDKLEIFKFYNKVTKLESF